MVIFGHIYINVVLVVIVIGLVTLYIIGALLVMDYLQEIITTINVRLELEKVSFDKVDELGYNVHDLAKEMAEVKRESRLSLKSP